jgi:hypothetical protein
MQVIEDENIAFGFQNDNENLYMCMVTRDRGKLMKILTGGLTVWLESPAEKSGFRFPERFRFDELRESRDREESGNEGRVNRFRNLIQQKAFLSVIDKKENIIKTVPIDGSGGIKARLDLQEDQCIYQLQIPLSTNSAAAYVFNGAPTDRLSVLIETGKFERPERGGSMRQGGEGGPPGGGMGRPGGRGGLGGGEGRSRGEFNPDPLKYQFDVQLSKK